MIAIIFQILSWLTFTIFLIVLSFLFFWMWSIMRSKFPFIPVPLKILRDIEKALDIKDDSVVYDLGSGDGRILFYLAKKHPKAQYIGIENSPFPLTLSKINDWLRNKENTNVKIIDEDFFSTDLSKATHIITYLYPNIMDDLINKFDKELKPGTKLISVSFHFTTKREVELIDLKRGKYQLAKQIYVYEF